MRYNFPGLIFTLLCGMSFGIAMAVLLDDVRSKHRLLISIAMGMFGVVLVGVAYYFFRYH